jgi:hypothetical protein
VAFCSVPRRWLVKLARRCSASGRCRQLSLRFLLGNGMLIASPMPGDANACFETVRGCCRYRCVELKRNGFSITSVRHALKIFQSAHKAVDARQVALAWKRALPVALKLREIEKAGRVIISRRFAIWMLISCITKIAIERKN